MASVLTAVPIVLTVLGLLVVNVLQASTCMKEVVYQLVRVATHLIDRLRLLVLLRYSRSML